MKRTIAALTCATALATSLTACGGEAKSSLPLYTPGSSPSSTATSPPTTPPTTAGPLALAAHTTYTYGGLKVIVDLPADISSASRPRARLFSDFLRGVNQTMARNKLDPSVRNLASPDVLKYVRTFIEPTSAQGVGSMTYTISSVHTFTNGPTEIIGCLHSKLSQIRKDGSRYVDANTKKYPTLKMSANIDPENGGQAVNRFAFAIGPC